MSTQSDDHDHNRRDQSNHQSSTSSYTNDNPPPQPPPQPPNNQSPAYGYPPAMGYPPQMIVYPNAPYPGYPHPPHGYNQYISAQHPPAPYYNQGYARQQDRCSGFVRGVVVAMIILIVFSCLSSLITWAILRPQIPVFHVDNMSVSNFNTKSTPFTATWDTNLTVENPNHKLRVYFDKIVGYMFYDDEDSLGSSWLNPIFMDTKTNTSLHAIISANGTAQNAMPIWVAQDMDKDRGTGSVTFALRFRVWATFKSGSWWTRSLVMRVLCEDLKVDFVGASGNGALSPAKRDDCEVYT
ncbi:hypothetical protein DITRI_Ditri12bG0126600 [Diplodiscus trichospermus]